MDKWEAFWPLVPTGVATVPAEWQPPKWPTRAEIQALRRPNQSGAGPSATTDLDAETRLALEGARCFVPLVDPVVHAGRPAAVRRAEDAAVALKQASAAAWEGIEVGKPVMCQHPGLKDGCDLLCSPLMPFTPLLYAVARNITGDLSPDAVVELECYGSHSYTTRFSPFSPSSAHFPLPAATRTGTHTFSVKASTIVLSSWRAGGGKVRRVGLTSSGTLTQHTKDAVVGLSLDWIQWDGYGTPAMAEKTAVGLFKSRVMDVPEPEWLVGTLVCKIFSGPNSGEKRYHGHVTAFSKEHDMAHLLYSDGDDEIVGFDEVQAALCACPGVQLPNLPPASIARGKADITECIRKQVAQRSTAMKQAKATPRHKRRPPIIPDSDSDD
eukprot:jgi/Mesvir1/22456/Mv25715-RA.1